MALPPLLPGSGLFRRARWNYVRKAFFSFSSPRHPLPLYIRALSQPTFHFPLFTLLPTPSYQRRLRRTRFLSTLHKTRPKAASFESFGDFSRDFSSLNYGYLKNSKIYSTICVMRCVRVMLYFIYSINNSRTHLHDNCSPRNKRDKRHKQRKKRKLKITTIRKGHES